MRPAAATGLPTALGLPTAEQLVLSEALTAALDEADPSRWTMPGCRRFFGEADPDGIPISP